MSRGNDETENPDAPAAKKRAAGKRGSGALLAPKRRYTASTRGGNGNGIRRSERNKGEEPVKVQGDGDFHDRSSVDQGVRDVPDKSSVEEGGRDANDGSSVEEGGPETQDVLQLDASQSLFMTPAKAARNNKTHVEEGEGKTNQTLKDGNGMEVESSGSQRPTYESEEIMSSWEEPAPPQGQRAKTDGDDMKHLLRKFREGKQFIESSGDDSEGEKYSEDKTEREGNTPLARTAGMTDVFGKETTDVVESRGSSEQGIPAATPSDPDGFNQELTLEEEDVVQNAGNVTAVSGSANRRSGRVTSSEEDDPGQSEGGPREPIPLSPGAASSANDDVTSENEHTVEDQEVATLAHAEKVKKLAKLVDKHTKAMRKNLCMKKSQGQHKYVAKDTVLPKFTDDLVDILNFGSKKEIARKYHEIAKQIKEDMFLEGGSGNMRYYSQLRHELLLEYPRLDNALLRNNYRRMLNPKVSTSELSEDSEEEEDLRPTDPANRRTFTTGNALVKLTDVVSRFNRNGRRKEAKLQVVEKAAEGVEVNGIHKLRNARWLRAKMPVIIEDDANMHLTKIKRVYDSSKPGVDFEEGYRKTFGLRTKALKQTKARLNDVLLVYPLLKFKDFLRIEAEGFLGSEDNCIKYFQNVQLAWKGISNLDTNKSPEKNFEETFTVLGSLVVLFSEDKDRLPQDKHKWPYIIHTPLQTRLIYQQSDFLGIEDLKQGLGYLILLFNMFDLPAASRPQLVLLLESLFFGYKAPALSDKNVIFMNKITELAQQKQ